MHPYNQMPVSLFFFFYLRRHVLCRLMCPNRGPNLRPTQFIGVVASAG